MLGRENSETGANRKKGNNTAGERSEEKRLEGKESPYQKERLSSGGKKQLRDKLLEVLIGESSKKGTKNEGFGGKRFFQEMGEPKKV